MTPSTTRAETGARGEDLAAAHLSAAGYDILVRNWRCRYGEIDIIASDTRALVFVEVKTRTSTGFGTPAEAVTYAKLRRLRRLAGIWLAERSGSWPEIRIDVIEVRLGAAAPQINHLVAVS